MLCGRAVVVVVGQARGRGGGGRGRGYVDMLNGGARDRGARRYGILLGYEEDVRWIAARRRGHGFEVGRLRLGWTRIHPSSGGGGGRPFRSSPDRDTLGKGKGILTGHFFPRSAMAFSLGSAGLSNLSYSCTS